MYLMTEFGITSYLYSSQDCSRQPTKNKTKQNTVAQGKASLSYLLDTESEIALWYHQFFTYLIISKFLSRTFSGFFKFFCRETENICTHVSLNITDLQVPLPNDVLKITVKTYLNLNLYIWTNWDW